MSEGTPGKEEWERRVNAELAKRYYGRDGDAFFFDRLFTRAARIGVGVALAAGSYWLLNHAYDSLSKPFASLSPLELLVGIVSGECAYSAH